MVGIIDDDGVGIGYVDAVFYYRGRDKHVVFVVYETDNDFLQFFGLHLSVSYCNAAVGDVTLYYLTHLFEGGNAVADEINLSVSGHLEVDGVGNELCGECCHLRVDRLTVGWGSTHDTHVARSHK